VAIGECDFREGEAPAEPYFFAMMPRLGGSLALPFRIAAQAAFFIAALHAARCPHWRLARTSELTQRLVLVGRNVL
jgi:hypothetical protein